MDRNQGPGYYHFTLDGLSAFSSLQMMRVSVKAHESHSDRRMDMWVNTSLPSSADEEIQGYDFSLREETGLLYWPRRWLAESFCV